MRNSLQVLYLSVIRIIKKPKKLKIKLELDFNGLKIIK